MDSPAAGGIVLLILIGIGFALGISVAAVQLHRLHTTARQEGTDEY